MLNKTDKNKERQRRHARVRTKVSANIHVQVIDDVNKVTLAACSSVELKLANGGNIEAAKAVGAEIAKRCADKGITKVVFDRGGYVYHGRVQALADAAREAGLKF